MDNTGFAGTNPCMPEPKGACAAREEWTSAERAAWRAWQAEHLERMAVVLVAIPDDGDQGELACPACGAGQVRWSRARNNHHLHARCSTPDCFQVMQ